MTNCEPTYNEDQGCCCIKIEIDISQITPSQPTCVNIFNYVADQFEQIEDGTQITELLEDLSVGLEIEDNSQTNFCCPECGPYFFGSAEDFAAFSEATQLENGCCTNWTSSVETSIIVLEVIDQFNPDIETCDNGFTLASMNVLSLSNTAQQSSILNFGIVEYGSISEYPSTQLTQIISMLNSFVSNGSNTGLIDMFILLLQSGIVIDCTENIFWIGDKNAYLTRIQA